MNWRAVTIVASLGLHGLIGAAALNAAHEKKARRATTVSLAEEKKKKPVEKKPDPPKPPPPRLQPPKVAPRPVAAAPAPVATAAPAPAAAAPMQTNISLGNEVGMETGAPREPGTAKPGEGTKPVKPAAAAAKPSAKPDVAPPPQAADGACAEPPGKPEPAMKTEIEYTEEARAAGIEGRLVLEVTVDADGNVTDVKVVTGVDPALDSAAIATVKTWRFKPALACGKPVAGGKYKIARRFELGD